MKFVYIHGATASERSFAFIQKSINAKDPIFLNYEKDGTASGNLSEMIEQLNSHKDDYFIVSHSLGGIYAVYLQKEIQKINFDIIITTDINCVNKYKKLTKSNIFVMPFTVDPLSINNIGRNNDNNESFFAGSYYYHLSDERKNNTNILIDKLVYIQKIIDSNKTDKHNNNIEKILDNII